MNQPLTRRTVLTRSALVAAGLGVGAAAGFGVVALTDDEPSAAEPISPEGAAVPATGAYQAGIATPETPQRNGLVLSLDLPATVNLGFLEALGARILELTSAGDENLLPSGPGNLTVTVGLGPRVVASVTPEGPGAEDLPLFANDDGIGDSQRGGDLLLGLYAEDPGILLPVAQALMTLIPGATHRWQQRCFRSPGVGTVVRNPLGFADGIIVPRSAEDLETNVWLPAPLAGGSICVIRRLRLATDEFRAHSVPEQEAIIGRRKAGSEPLSGGGELDEINLLAKSEDGEYLVPSRSHARAAHPSFTGSKLMFRRGYGFDNGETADGTADSGLMFICFAADLRTFVASQQRLDETDDLMEYVTPTASATFLILPGFSAEKPLGADLMATS